MVTTKLTTMKSIHTLSIFKYTPLRYITKSIYRVIDSSSKGKDRIEYVYSIHTEYVYTRSRLFEYPEDKNEANSHKEH